MKSLFVTFKALWARGVTDDFFYLFFMGLFHIPFPRPGRLQGSTFWLYGFLVMGVIPSRGRCSLLSFFVCMRRENFSPQTRDVPPRAPRTNSPYPPVNGMWPGLIRGMFDLTTQLLTPLDNLSWETTLLVKPHLLTFLAI